MLTDSQIDSLSSAHTEISAIIQDLTERMKAKGYAKASAEVDFGRYRPTVWLRIPGTKEFHAPYDRESRDFAMCGADTLPDAIEKAYAAIDALDDMTALDNWFTEQPVIAGGAS